MHELDWLAVGVYLCACIGFSLWLLRRRRETATGEGYALANRKLPWWVIGVADVATGDGADAYWVHIFFVGGFIGYHRFFWVVGLLSLPLGVLWARYWRRLSLRSPGHLFEVRYGGDGARKFRGFSAVYGVLFGQCVLVGYVLRGFAESLAPLLGWSVPQLLLVFGGATLFYTLLAGLLAVAYMDLLQFTLVMAARIAFAAILLKAAGGLGPVLDKVEALRGAAFLSPYPPSATADAARFGEFALDPLSLCALICVGLFTVANPQSPAVQKALAARDERHAAGGQMLNSVLSLAVRTLPLILIGLCAVAAFPPGSSFAKGTDQWAELVRRHVPAGLFGLLVTGIIAGYTSTLAGLLNFGASQLLNDLYLRTLRPSAGPVEQLRAGRLLTLLAALAGNLWAWLLFVRIDAAWLNFINSVVLLFVLPVALLRWVWWRLNLQGEIVGFVAAFPLTYAVWFGPFGLPAWKDRPYWQPFALLFGLGMALIVTVTLLTPAAPREVLVRFYRTVRPPGFWGPIAKAAREEPHSDGTPPDPSHDARARRELIGGLYACAFAIGIVLGMSALLVRRTAEGIGFLLGSAVAGALLLRRTSPASQAKPS